jgi:flagellar motor switch protein FliG
MDDDFLQRLMRELDSDELAIAIRHAGKELQNVFFRNMGERAVEMLLEDMYYMGDIEQEKIEEAQQKIVNMINLLKKEEI